MNVMIMSLGPGTVRGSHEAPGPSKLNSGRVERGEFGQACSRARHRPQRITTRIKIIGILVIQLYLLE